MATVKNLNTKIKQQNNTGFGTNSTYSAGRFVKKDGSVNIRKKGLDVFRRYSIYHTMLNLSRTRFLLIIFGFFLSVNLIFAVVYYEIGVQNLGGVTVGTRLENFTEAYFFSAQTFTTVGYGRINPSGVAASSIAAIEALTGLLSFAVVTGLFYGRFSRPRAFLRFSDHMVIAPYAGATALMFRMVSYKNNLLTDVEVKVTLAIKVGEDGKTNNQFYPLDLEFSLINALTLSWTVVHPLDEKSPLSGFNEEDIINANAEFIVYVKGFDEAFSNTVVARTSYTSQEIIWGARFALMYQADQEDNSTILYLDRLNEVEKVPLPAAVKQPQGEKENYSQNFTG